MGILGGLFGGKVELQVTTDKGEYLPAETVSAQVEITGRGRVEVDEARLELVCENEYTYRDTSYTGTGSSSGTTTTHDVTSTDREVYARAQLFGPRTIHSGDSIEQSAALRIPDGAVPSGDGEITKVRWKVALVLSREHRPDPDAETPIVIVSPPSAFRQHGAAPPQLDVPGDWRLELRLPHGRDVRTGTTLAGTLVVTPAEEIDAQEVRVELYRHEHVPRGAGNDDETVEQSIVLEERPSLTARVPRELPFELAVPAGVCPTLETPQSTVRWYLRGVVARRLRSDYNVVEELNVYSGPNGRG